MPLTLQEKRNLEKLRNLLCELPSWCFSFFIAIEPQTSVLTRINYAYDLRQFFRYAAAQLPVCLQSDPKEITIEQINQITAQDLERYLEYLNLYYSSDGRQLENHECGKSRKLASLRTFFKYLFKHEAIEKNVAALVEMPKLHQKDIIRLEPDEVARLLDAAQNGEALTPRQMAFHRYTQTRDVAMLTLFLGTGIRISECVGLNIDDIDFNADAFRVRRKGGKVATLYFWTEVEQALLDYLQQREKIEALPGHEDALFLSLQRKRISVRAVQELVKKYARISAPLKKITPHKLRSTYGTSLYKETGDIYLVADVLGHTDVNTTRKHYAAMSEDRRRLAARAVTLRDDEDETVSIPNIQNDLHNEMQNREAHKSSTFDRTVRK